MSKKTKCIVTGGAGFIGSHLVDLLISQGMEVTIIDDLSTGREEIINSEARFVKEDAANFKKIESYFNDVDFVFHLAALPRIQPSFDYPLEHERANVLGTINCLLACRNKKGIKKFVFSGASACYGTPDELPTTEKAEIRCLSPYALQKYAAEQYGLILGKRYGIPVVSLRYSNVYGPNSFNPKNPFNAYSCVIGIFENQKKEGKPLTITGDGEQSRDFIHVNDVARANLLAAQSRFQNEIYNIGAGKTYSINQIAKMFKTKYVYIPKRKGEAKITWLDAKKAKEELDWISAIEIKDYVKDRS
jgi:UDP-glucose 4-epimerase